MSAFDRTAIACAATVLLGPWAILGCIAIKARFWDAPAPKHPHWEQDPVRREILEKMLRRMK